MKLRTLTAAEVEFEDTDESETIPLEGNCLASGDDEVDREYEKELIERLERGDNSAWCCLTVEAIWQGHIGYASLGGFTFPEGNTGIQNQEYASEDIAQLREEALDHLNEQLQATVDLLSTLSEPEKKASADLLGTLKELETQA